MPRACFVSILFLATFVSTKSQVVLSNGKALPDSLQHKYRVNFAIPDMPAFVLLGTEPSSMVRPTSVREFTAAFSEFTGSGRSLALPKSFAIEFSPGLILGGRKLSVREYANMSWLYRLRVSAATRRDEGAGEPTLLALGLRTSIIDDSDPRTSEEYSRRVVAVTDRINDIYVQARLHSGPPPAPIVLSPEEERQVNDLQEELKEQWAEDKWNARLFEVALGTRGLAQDSTGSSFTIVSWTAWSDYTFGFGDWGQILFGGRLSSERDTGSTGFNTSGSFSSRFYVGSSKFKAFIEGQLSKMEGGQSEWLINTGAEVSISNGMWASFSGGLQYSADVPKPRLNTSLRLNLSFVDLFSLLGREK
jgi:hypothetical protein